MKPSVSFIIKAVALVALLAFGFSQLAGQIGAPAAAGLYLALNFAAFQSLGGFSAAFGVSAVELAKLNAADDLVGLVEENQNVAPELTIVPAFTIKGTSFPTITRKTFPSGAFKKRGAGVAVGTTTFENGLVQCFPYENPMQETVDIVKAYRRGSAAFLSLVASGAVKGGMQLIGKALYYGARSFGGGVDAHPGLIDMYDSTNMVIDAAGTTADTGSSVWFIKWGNQEDGNVSYVFGNDRVFELGEWMRQLVEVSTGKKAMCEVNSLAADIGVQLTNLKACGRIKKLTEDSGKGLTDALGYKLLEKFPVGIVPDVALMTKRSRRQLQESRSAVGQTAYGSGAVAPLPTDIAGVPIVVTDSILNTEALTL
jgi:hypothetical protein